MIPLILLLSLEFVYRELVVFEATYGLNAEQRQGTDIIRNSLSTLRSLSDLRSMPENHRYILYLLDWLVGCIFKYHKINCHTLLRMAFQCPKLLI